MRIKISGNEMEVTLLVHGREKTFTEKQLIAALEKGISDENPLTNTVSDKEHDSSKK